MELCLRFDLGDYEKTRAFEGLLVFQVHVFQNYLQSFKKILSFFFFFFWKSDSSSIVFYQCEKGNLVRAAETMKSAEAAGIRVCD